jgi:hypothetical protein
MIRARSALLLLFTPVLAACEEATISCNVPDALASVGVGGAGPRRLSTVAPAVRVTVVDAATGRNVSGGATGSYVSGTVADSLRHHFPTMLVAYGPAGRYSLVVQHPGYATWGRDDVRVSTGECGELDSAEVTARLQPLGGQP